jgi:glycosyltransferase involved in cell wall biosynthesis
MLQNNLSEALSQFQREQTEKYPEKDLIKIDLHCHDFNSDEPDEILGRILNVPETWLETDDLIKELKFNKVDAITITNHNNARSCFSLQERGVDVLVGAEFSCRVPDFGIGIHVLAYGFNAEQEKKLNIHRKNIYSFLEYACEQDIPTIWAHPLYYHSDMIPTIDFFEKMSLIFERFEVLNGQRDTWQNMLTKVWIDHLSPDIIDQYAKKHQLDVAKYCKNTYRKSMSGGSDSHIGIFAGQTGTNLYIPNLQQRLVNESYAKLALDAIKNGDMAPYGSHHNSEKLTIALLDYVCQISLNRKDPGLFRILLHKGTVNDKIWALIISNAFSEVQHHKITMKFIDLFHNCILGNQPKFTKRWFVPNDYKPAFDNAVKMASAKKVKTGNRAQPYNDAIDAIHQSLVKLLYSRLNKKIIDLNTNDLLKNLDFNTILQSFEIPSEIRTLLGKRDNKSISSFNKTDIKELLNGLSFPFLASALILAANYTSAKVLYNNRILLNTLSEKFNKFQHQKRMLWLTDSFNDKNGVSMFLQTMHKEIKARNLPIDILVCSDTIDPDDHLIVIKPLFEMALPMYKNQNFTIPNFLEIHQLFQHNEYDRIMCSTEGPMGLASLYLKNAFTVETNFFIHTDWVMFGRKVLNLERHNLNRFRRILRAYYKGFDQLFVLNTDQEKWLVGREMNVEPNRVHLTAHWVDDIFSPSKSNKTELFGVKSTDPVLLFVGRISHEKGIMELVSLYETVKAKNKKIKLVIAGTGPALDELKKAIPDAIYLGWVKQERLPSLYSSADLLVLPSKFDTFSCVVLEALSCGLPVVSYKTKGPKDIIIDQNCGYLISDINEMSHCVISYLENKPMQSEMKNNAILRARDYKSDNILEKLLIDVHLIPEKN